MNKRPLSSDLLKVNFIVSLLINLISFIFFSISKMPTYNAVIYSVMGLTLLFIEGLITFITLNSKHFDLSNSSLKQFTKFRYLSLYAINPSIHFLITLLFKPLTRIPTNTWFNPRVAIIILLTSWISTFIFSFLYKYIFLQNSKLYAEIENLKLKSIISETSNQLLKQQVHPHFLFNALNTVKSLYKKDLEKGELYLVHLANFLRESISNPTSKLVTLDYEFNLCNEYIAMQKLRFGESLKCQFDNTHLMGNSKFVPYFAIQTLLENAIKHNELTEEKPLYIHVRIDQQYVTVSNNLQPKHINEISTGQGLYNLRERYRLLSGDDILIKEANNQFSVSIKLLKDEDSYNRG